MKELPHDAYRAMLKKGKVKRHIVLPATIDDRLKQIAAARTAEARETRGKKRYQATVTHGELITIAVIAWLRTTK